ncbi:hypothetical protein [Microbacterium sp. KR10-403]|uniref:hypothetical protein n=1 Tax=Microbacterium sp. KR10-403 TaxID=3158581 RepID=UPI0032E3D8E3
MKKNLVRACALAAGVFVLGSVATAAIADDQQDGGDVTVNVAIPQVETPGVLALSVAGTSATLAEDGSTALVRQFTGTLPAVTVTDTRTAEQIPDGASWYVLGTATDFVGTDGQDAISADHLGWSPVLVDGGETGLVAEGDPADTVLDGGAGLVDQELLVSTAASDEVASEGSWTASAGLTLQTPADVAPGDYSSTITLSLFE